MIKITQINRGFLLPRVALSDLGRVSIILTGLIVFVLALTAPMLRRPDGYLPMEGWTLALGGVALVIFGVAWRTRWQKTSIFLGIALLGQAVTLGLIKAPNFGILQHYYSWGVILDSHRVTDLDFKTAESAGIRRIRSRVL